MRNYSLVLIPTLAFLNWGTTAVFASDVLTEPLPAPTPHDFFPPQPYHPRDDALAARHVAAAHVRPTMMVVTNGVGSNPHLEHIGRQIHNADYGAAEPPISSPSGTYASTAPVASQTATPQKRDGDQGGDGEAKDEEHTIAGELPVPGGEQTPDDPNSSDNSGGDQNSDNQTPDHDDDDPYEDEQVPDDDVSSREVHDSRSLPAGVHVGENSKQVDSDHPPAGRRQVPPIRRLSTPALPVEGHVGEDSKQVDSNSLSTPSIPWPTPQSRRRGWSRGDSV